VTSAGAPDPSIGSESDLSGLFARDRAPAPAPTPSIKSPPPASRAVANPDLAGLLPTDIFAGGPHTAPSIPAVLAAQPPRADLPAGSILDKYRIEALLGTGGFAAVYRATHLLLRVPVAIKLLRSDVVRAHPRFTRLLCDEAGMAAKVDHPNVVRVLDVTHTQRITYIVLEYVDGRSLAAAIRKCGRLPIEEVIRIGVDVCTGLEAALRSGLVHRDVKPGNILLTKAGAAKVADFMAYRADAADAGRMVGTPQYMSPEQARHPADVDFRTDIFSLGASLFHAAGGRLPFAEGSAPAEPRALVESDLGEPLLRVLRAMTHFDPAARPASYDACRRELTAAG